ncbi:MAG: ATP-binding protein [Caulobacteraceae bacterium]
MPRFTAPPLIVQALGLVIATLVATHLTTMLVVLSLPPPAPDIYRLSEVVRTVRTQQVVETRDGLPLAARIDWRRPDPETDGRRQIDFRNRLAQQLGMDPRDVVVSQNSTRIIAVFVSRRSNEASRTPQDMEPLIWGDFRLGIRQNDGRWLIIAPKHAFRIDPWQQRVLLVLGIAALAVSPLAWWFARRISAPIAALGSAAERLGRDPRAPPLQIRGSSEVNSAVAAFNEMQERLRRYVDDRTAMVGAIAHDLRTPLTRLRFRVEAVPDDVKAKIVNDIDQMEAMISATLSFVKDTARPRERTRMELASLVETVMDEAAETGRDTAVERADRVVIEGDPLALKRLLTNLVDNALKFGKRARARVFIKDGSAVVEIEDNGPGMPECELERAFEPFHRLEGSRSRDTGGAGLGLAVVRAVARGHGGDVTLENRAKGGLIARVTLPL